MIVRVVEIRDKATFIPALAINTMPANEGQRYLLRRAGYASNGETTILVHLSSGQANYDVYAWNNRTMQQAHNWIQEHFHELNDGDVVDVEYILGVSKSPKLSERFEVFE